MLVKRGYTVYTHLTHFNDGTRKGSMVAEVMGICKNTVTVRVLKNNKVFYVSPNAIVGIRKKSTMNNCVRMLANKFNNN